MVYDFKNIALSIIKVRRPGNIYILIFDALINDELEYLKPGYSSILQLQILSLDEHIWPQASLEKGQLYVSTRGLRKSKLSRVSVCTIAL